MFASTRCGRKRPNARRSRYRQPAQHALTGRVSPGRPSANLKDASLNPIKTFLVATTFAHHCPGPSSTATRSEEHTSELQSLAYLVCRLLLEKKKNKSRHLT